jgi:hypothetical protein
MMLKLLSVALSLSIPGTAFAQTVGAPIGGNAAPIPGAPIALAPEALEELGRAADALPLELSAVALPQLEALVLREKTIGVRALLGALSSREPVQARVERLRAVGVVEPQLARIGRLAEVWSQARTTDRDVDRLLTTIEETMFSPSDEVLAAKATDRSEGLVERLTAVRRLSERGAFSAEALKAVSASNPDGGADEYTVHQAALRAMAKLGVVEPLRPISAAHAEAILAHLNIRKPDVAFEGDVIKIAGPNGHGGPESFRISINGNADPRPYDGTVVWPKKGADAVAEIKDALARRSAEAVDPKTAFGLFAQRSISMVAFIAVTIAYPFAAVPAVGWNGYGVLMAFSPMAGIAAGPIAGIVLDKLPTRTAMLINTALRGVLLLGLPLFKLFGVMNFGTLLIASLAEGWLLSTIMTTEGAFLKRLFPAKHLGTLNSLLFINYLALQVILGLIVGLGHIVDKWNPFAVFTGAAAINLLLVMPVIWVTIPNLPSLAKAAAARPGSTSAAPKTPFLKKYWKEALVFVGAIASYPLLHTPLPVAAALLFWIARTDNFHLVWKGDGLDPKATGDASSLRRSMLLLALAALMMYPLQYFGLPHIAEELVGASGKGLLLGQFLGALFFGNMISTAAQAKLPDAKLGSLSVPGQRFIQLGVMGLAAAWVFVRLVPGSVLASLAAAAISAGLMALAQKLSARAWIKFVGAGFSAIWLPYMAWKGLLPFLSVPTAMMVALIAIGMSYGPSFVSLISYFMGNASKADMGKITGIQGAFFNAAISTGYGLLTLASGFVHPAFPALLAVLGVAYLLGGAVFAKAPRLLKGVPAELLRKKEEPKK